MSAAVRDDMNWCHEVHGLWYTIAYLGPMVQELWEKLFTLEGCREKSNILRGESDFYYKKRS